MVDLNIDSLDENPWNVLSQPLPPDPSRLLLLNAQIAATCLRQIASETIEACGEGLVERWLDPRVDRASELFMKSNGKIGEILTKLDMLYGLEPLDFWLSRDVKKSVCEKVRAFIRRIVNEVSYRFYRLY